MDIEAPTFTSLNKPQRRALILRDHLRFTAPHHLESLIQGITDHEPPSYSKVSGTIQPPLKFVTIKAEGTRFDLGNVLFPEENNTVHRAYLAMQGNRVEIRTAEAIPQDEANLDSVAIHVFIAKTMVPLFKDKYEAIFARMTGINEARRAAYNLAAQDPARFEYGQTLARLDPKTAAPKNRKRQPGDPVQKHVSNMRKITGLDIIPDDVKSATFNTIPEQIKVNLFDNILKTAIPNFDNLMVAAWNVVSIYAACGSDFPELHKSIVDLNSVLQDYDESFEANVVRTSLKYRHDLAGSSKDKGEARNFVPIPDNNRVDMTKAASADGDDNLGAEALTDDQDAVMANVIKREKSSSHDMPPPQLLSEQPREESSEGDDFVPARNPTLDYRHSTSRQPSSRPRTSQGSVHKSVTPSPSQQTGKLPSNSLKRQREGIHTSSADPRDAFSARTTQSPQALIPSSRVSPRTTPPPKKKKTLADLTATELRDKFINRRHSLIKTFSSIEEVPEKQLARLDELERAVKEKEKEKEEQEPAPAGVYLGNSMLGMKKSGGTAPVANMLRGKTDRFGGGHPGTKKGG